MADLKTLRLESRALFRDGDLDSAIRKQNEVIRLCEESDKALEFRQLALYVYNKQNYELTAQICLLILRDYDPDDAIAKVNLAHSYVFMGNLEMAVKYLHEVLGQQDESTPITEIISVHDHLSHAYGVLGEGKYHKEAKEHGLQTLLLHDKRYTGLPLPLEQKQWPYDATAPKRNVISFSLWGDQDKYCLGAIENARIARVLFPEWQCRFYCDGSVPESVIGQLLAFGADIVMMPMHTNIYEGLFWRFQVANDQSIDRFLVRDTDGVLSIREREAVVDWIEDGRPFHMMRDHTSHTSLILAGMWGGVAGLLPDLNRLAIPYFDRSSSRGDSRSCDQNFLAAEIWPLVKPHMLIHDDIWGCFDAKPFPKHATQMNVEGGHVGQCFLPWAVMQKGSVLHQGGEQSIRQKLLFVLSTGRSGTSYLTKLLSKNLANADVYHERTSFDRMGELTPDASHLMAFNSSGNTEKVKAFWRQKFNALRVGQNPVYAEVSHFLGKAGLIENLAYIKDDVDVSIIYLKRNEFDVAWSLGNRFDFGNTGFTWLFYLDPNYPRNIVDSSPYRQYGMWGSAAWYCREMAARAKRYRKKVEKLGNVSFHEVDLESIVQPEGSTALLNQLDVPLNNKICHIENRKNESKGWMFGERERTLLTNILESIPFDLDDY